MWLVSLTLGGSLVQGKVLVIVACILLIRSSRKDRIRSVDPTFTSIGGILVVVRGGSRDCTLTHHLWHFALLMGCNLVHGKSEGFVVSSMVVRLQVGSNINPYT